MIARGAIVNISKSLLLFEETKKINTPIKKRKIIFLNDACVTIGRLDSVANIEITKTRPQS
jgi:hypothetical protein